MLHLAAAIYKTNSREFNILAALLRAGKLALPELPEVVQAEIDGGRAPGMNLSLALHSQLTLETLGFSYSKDVILTLSWLDETELAHVHANLTNMLKRSLGAHQVFTPMYPNFPAQVLEASDAELLVNAWMHYLGDWLGVRILPMYANAKRPPITQLKNLKPTVLEQAERNAVEDQLSRLLNGNASLSDANKALLLELLNFFLESHQHRLVDVLKAAVVPQKEIRALVGGWLLQVAPVNTWEAAAKSLYLQTAPVTGFEIVNFARLFQTPTDVLRLSAAVSASDLKAADLTLSKPPRFGKLSRPVRRLLLGLLNAQKADSVRAEMFQRREQWVRLGEALHPGEYQARFQRAYDHFTALRNNDSPVSWAGTVEKRIASRDTLAAIGLLVERPGVFARKLHEVVRKARGSQKDIVVDAFVHVADKVSTSVLVQLRHRMQVELSALAVQSFAPKAGAGRLWVPAEPAQRMSVLNGPAETIIKAVDAVLAARFGQLPAMGKVFIDPALVDYSISFGQRTAQKALCTVGRGSRIDLGDERIMRAFLWWNEAGLDKDGNRYSIGRTDLDLSCAVLDSGFDYVDHCSFTKLRASGLTHSGDITSAPNGACEFIDIDFDALPADAAYIAMVSFSYTRQSYADMPEAFFGWMARADGQSGEVFDARTVRQKVDLTTTGERVLVGYVDVARRQFVWADVVLPARCGGFNAIETARVMTGVLARGVVNPVRPTIGALLSDHILARGECVEHLADADIVFTSARPGTLAPAKAGQQVVTAYDAELLIANYLK